MVTRLVRVASASFRKALPIGIHTRAAGRDHKPFAARDTLQHSTAQHTFSADSLPHVARHFCTPVAQWAAVPAQPRKPHQSLLRMTGARTRRQTGDLRYSIRAGATESQRRQGTAANERHGTRARAQNPKLRPKFARLRRWKTRRHGPHDSRQTTALPSCQEYQARMKFLDQVPLMKRLPKDEHPIVAEACEATAVPP